METLKFKPGTPALTVIDEIRQKAFDPDSFGTVDEYIVWLAENLSRCHDIVITVTGNTTDERAESLVAELLQHGLISYE